MPRSESSAGAKGAGEDSPREEIIAGPANDGWKSAETMLDGPARLAAEASAGDAGRAGSYVAAWDPARHIWHLVDAASAPAAAPAEPKDEAGGGAPAPAKGGGAPAPPPREGRRPIDDDHSGPAPRHRDVRWNVLHGDSDASDASDGEPSSDTAPLRAPDYLLGENGDAPAPPKADRRRRGDGRGGGGAKGSGGGAKGGDGGAKGDDDDGGGGAKGGGHTRGERKG